MPPPFSCFRLVVRVGSPVKAVEECGFTSTCVSASSLGRATRWQMLWDCSFGNHVLNTSGFARPSPGLPLLGMSLFGRW